MPIHAEPITLALHAPDSPAFTVSLPRHTRASSHAHVKHLDAAVKAIEEALVILELEEEDEAQKKEGESEAEENEEEEVEAALWGGGCGSSSSVSSQNLKRMTHGTQMHAS